MPVTGLNVISMRNSRDSYFAITPPWTLGGLAAEFAHMGGLPMNCQLTFDFILRLEQVRALHLCLLIIFAALLLWSDHDVAS